MHHARSNAWQSVFQVLRQLIQPNSTHTWTRARSTATVVYFTPNTRPCIVLPNACRGTHTSTMQAMLQHPAPVADFPEPRATTPSTRLRLGSGPLAPARMPRAFRLDSTGRVPLLPSQPMCIWVRFCAAGTGSMRNPMTSTRAPYGRTRRIEYPEAFPLVPIETV